MTASLLLTLREELVRAGDPDRARGAQRYMKSAMPFHGVPAPLFRSVCRRVFAGADLSTAERWKRSVLGLWRGAEFREERYAAIALSGDRRALPFQKVGTLPMYEEMIVTGAWWDTVDAIASNRIGPLLRLHPKPMRRELLAWSRGTDIWKRRTAILSQLRFKSDTDLELLYACIEPSLGSIEFFLRKAIGWALRQYAWTDPAEIARYVRERTDALSPLSRREAMKNISG